MCAGNACQLTRRHGDLDVRDSDVDVHAAVGRLRQRQRQVRGRQQEARRAARPQRAHHHLQPRDAAVRHHALRAAPQLEARFHLTTHFQFNMPRTQLTGSTFNRRAIGRFVKTGYVLDL